MFARNLGGGRGMPDVVRVDAIDAGNGFVDARKRQQAVPGRQMGGPAGVLDERRTARREIALCAIAEPSRLRGNVGMFCDPELGLRAVDEIAVLIRRTRDARRVDRVPAMLTQELLRPV